MQRFASVLVLCGMVAAVPARADADLPHRCGLFCKVWRNVSGHVQTPVSAPSWDDQTMHVPTIAEDARVPQAADIVAVHGEVIRKSQAERERERVQMADDLKRIDALREGGSETQQGSREAKRSKVGQSD